jgi:hypothetical protein
VRAIQITQFGKPEDVLRVVDVPEPPAPGPGEVKVTVELSPLNRHDLLLVSGALLQPPLPLVPGNEGVARVVEVGQGVSTVAVGEPGGHARALRPPAGPAVGPRALSAGGEAKPTGGIRPRTEHGRAHRPPHLIKGFGLVISLSRWWRHR